MFNGKYISLKEVIYRIKRHPLLTHVEIGDIAYDAIDVIKLAGAPLIYESKVKVLDVEEFRTELPCDLLNITSVGKLINNSISPLVSSTSTRAGNWKCVDENGFDSSELGTYAVKSNFIYFDFEEGTIEVNYRAIVRDDDGYPKVPDNTSLIKAIEAYVRVKHFGIKVDMGEMPINALDRAEQEYNWYIGQAQNSLIMPDLDEMEAIKNSLIRIVKDQNAHDYGFKYNSVNKDRPNIGGFTGGTISASEDVQVDKDLEIIFNFGVGELELDPIIITETDAGLYDTLTVDSNSVNGTININGTDTPVPFTLAVGDTVIGKRQVGTTNGWVKITN